MASWRPKPVKTHCNGEVALPSSSRGKTTAVKDSQCQYLPRKRKSDGFVAKTLCVYYLRKSTTTDKLSEIFSDYGPVKYVVKSTDTEAYVVFEWVCDAQKAKEDLDLQRTFGSGAWIDINLRCPKWRETAAGRANMEIGDRPHGPLRIDYRPCVPEKFRHLIPEPYRYENTARDDFYDDSVFDSPEVKKALKYP